MARSEGVLTVRTAVGLSRPDDVHYVRVAGPEAYEAADRIFPRELYLRDGQISHGLLLDPAGRIVADCYLALDDEEFFLLAEGPSEEELVDHLTRHTEGFEVEIRGADAGHGLIGIDGPYAWELLARLVGPEVIGLPYLTFFFEGDILVCRAGKTGEYGYLLIVPADRLQTTWDEVTAAAHDLDAAQVGREVLDVCALESWFFNIRAEGRADLTPLELQLQWRLSRRKTFVGSEALARRREAGLDRRLTCLVSEDPVTVGQTVSRDGRELGQVVNAIRSPTRGDWVALAPLELSHAHPSIPGFTVGDRAVARSVTPPVVDNRSLYVNPQVHSYATRHETDFPELRR